MSDPNAYTMLVTSLPSPGPLFLAKRAPLSGIRLNARLRVLAPEDAEALRLVESLLHWGELPMELTDEQIVGHIKDTMKKIENETLRLIVRDRLEIRTCVAALRRRLRGEGPPASGTLWGYGRWRTHIERNWNEEAFRLDRTFPWLREANRLLKAGDSLQLQRLILEQAWKSVSRYRGEHYFDFEAVVIDVIKWNIVERWARYNKEQAAERFGQLAQVALGEYQTLFAGEQP